MRDSCWWRPSTQSVEASKAKSMRRWSLVRRVREDRVEGGGGRRMREREPRGTSQAEEEVERREGSGGMGEEVEDERGGR